MKADELPEFIGENGHFSTIFDFSAHCLSDGKHGWYDAPKMEFSNGEKQSSSLRWKHRSMDLKQIL